MAVTLGKPVDAKDSADGWEFDEAFNEFIAIPVTIENIGSEPFETPELTISVTTGDRAADTFIDSSGGVEGDPYADVLPGRSITFKSGFAVISGAELVAKVSLFLGDDSVYYVQPGS